MARKPRTHWYPVTLTGKLVAAAYTCVPVCLVAADNAGLLTASSKVPALGGMGVVLVCMLASKYTRQKPFAQAPHKADGFTLVELLIVISIIGLLAAILFPSFQAARTKAEFARSLEEFRSIYTALQLYSLDHQNQYPPDASRGLPAGAEQYIAGGVWPAAPFPGSVYDWDAWAPGDLSYPPYAQVYQISIRFCTTVTSCNIPNASWAKNFDYYSALYYCIEGPCRAHSSQPVDYPGYCVNC